MIFKPSGLLVACFLFYFFLSGIDPLFSNHVKIPVVIDKTVISYKDIHSTAALRGRLGHPLCSLVKIRGKWIFKDVFELEFQVYQVNDLILENPVIFSAKSVRKILWDDFKGGAMPTGSGSWDWAIGAPGRTDPPRPVDGQEVEMLGIETGRFQSYSTEAWAEIRRFDEVPSPPQVGFISSFQFMAIKKLN